MAQLVEWLLLISEIRVLNPVIGKIYFERYWKDENKEKKPGMARCYTKLNIFNFWNQHIMDDSIGWSRF